MNGEERKERNSLKETLYLPIGTNQLANRRFNFRLLWCQSIKYKTTSSIFTKKSHTRTCTKNPRIIKDRKCATIYIGTESLFAHESARPAISLAVERNHLVTLERLPRRYYCPLLPTANERSSNQHSSQQCFRCHSLHQSSFIIALSSRCSFGVYYIICRTHQSTHLIIVVSGQCFLTDPKRLKVPLVASK